MLVALALIGAGKQPADPLAEIIAQNTRARGGSKAIDAARAVQLHLRIVEPKFAVDAVYKASREGRMRIDVSVKGKRVYSEGYDGQHGWQWPADAAHGSDASAAGEAALRHGLEYPISLRGLYEMQPRGHRLTYAGRENLDGTQYHVLKLTLKDGFTTYLYVNPETYLIDRQRDQRAIHPDADASVKWFEQRFKDYRRVDGRMVAFKSEQVDLRANQVRQTTTVVEVTTNPSFDAAVFARP